MNTRGTATSAMSRVIRTQPGEDDLRFFTEDECNHWLAGRERPDAIAGMPRERIWYPPKPHQFLFVAQWIGRSIMYQKPALLWITEAEIWPSSENWHLYYKLRQSYQDLRLLLEAPGHLFLGHEGEDLASFLQLAMLNGWGGHVLTAMNYVNVFFSHDEFIDFYAKDESLLDEVRQAFRRDAGTTSSAGNDAG